MCHSSHLWMTSDLGHWPYWQGPLTYSQARNADQSSIVGKVGAAILPAGAAGSTSLDGADA